ncbi:hypothetical protein AVEN_73292-1 [Araneus ventricosus]|uniref:Uncharacterized protein n=1 Tax=Araneus ventricosus TaxID=182803 RepID=A0A4Y2KJM6_ARAVE|nr:hypothetical protein AVEN_73292-1 [Araneus ventricosus]
MDTHLPHVLPLIYIMSYLFLASASCPTILHVMSYHPTCHPTTLHAMSYRRASTSCPHLTRIYLMSFPFVTSCACIYLIFYLRNIIDAHLTHIIFIFYKPVN